MSNETTTSNTTFKIHPAIGIARLGNSDEFYLTPEQPGALPIACDADGVEQQDKNGQPVRVSSFKESGDLSKVKRQAARFRIFAYDGDDQKTGEEIKIGGKYHFVVTSATTAPTPVEGTVKDIQWTVHLANKKSTWYDFMETDGMHGYSASHPLRNPTVTQPDLRRQMITDPGPQTVTLKSPRAAFSKGENPGYPQTFPPEDIKPNPIDTLGELMANKQGDNPRLVVLGGRGNSGSTKTPVITSFVNNDGWYDDISDGPVTAKIAYTYPFTYTNSDGKKVTETKNGVMEVQVPAWVVVGYPRYVPQMLDMITLDEAMYDVFVRNFQYAPRIFGVAPYDRASNTPKTEEETALWLNDAGFNPDYYPKFYEEIWPILRRPDLYQYTYDFDFFSGGDPHNTGTGGNLDQRALSTPPSGGQDPYRQNREYVIRIMREPLQTNLYFNTGKSKINPDHKPRLMPMLCGNNPISNTSPDKFLIMTRTQLFFLRQWAVGKFVNECSEWDESDPNCTNPWSEPPTTGEGIDRGVLSNLLGGAFCPGGEFSWIIINPGIYSAPYRIKHTTYQAGALSLPKPIADIDGSPAPNIAAGMEPGDLTKYIGIPWQADFHECTTQNIDVTYDNWNSIYLSSTGDPAEQQIAYDIPWWPAHRPIIIQTEQGQQVFWASGIPDNYAGDLEMVQQWNNLGFLIEPVDPASGLPAFYQIERNNAALGPPTASGQRTLGRSKRSTRYDR